MIEDKLKNIVKGIIHKVKKRLIGKEDQEIIDKYHNLYYNLGTYQFTEWGGRKVYKYPGDLFLYAEIIFKNKPDIIIETGTLHGGSALFYADILNILGNGKVISIDNVKRNYPKHERIQYIHSSSVDLQLIINLKRYCENKKVMVILDSDHHKEHVLREMKLYSEIVSQGQYMVVEDSDINGHPVYKSFGDGPFEAIQEFFKHNQSFKVDKNLENKYLFTANPNGWLKKLI